MTDPLLSALVARNRWLLARPAAFRHWSPPAGRYLLGAGLTSVLAQLALTRAYGQGRALLTANLNYSGILFASFWGWLIWHDILPLIAWLGIVLIIVAGILATWLTAYEAKPSHGGD